MKKLLVPVLQYALDKAKRNRFIQNLFESPFDLEKFPVFAEFEDGFGNKYQLRNGLRNKIRPNKAQTLQDQRRALDKAFLESQAGYGRIAVSKLWPLLCSQGFKPEMARVLEVGCHSGAACYAMAELGAKEVTGTEFSGYKVEAIQGHEAVDNQTLVEVNEDLISIRKALAGLFKRTEAVNFVDDDICNTHLPKEHFDVVISWEVLEHLHDPARAFQAMASRLKPGGWMIHEYNPFFCLNGGHSACTLDMLWGHALLNNEDFTRYVETFRPLEKERAVSFFKYGLNRMSIRDLEKHIADAGLRLEVLLPFTKEQHVRMVDADILNRCRNLYPNISVLDLASPRVILMAQKCKT